MLIDNGKEMETVPLVTPGRYSGTSFAVIDGKGRVAVPASLRNNIPTTPDDKNSKDNKNGMKVKSERVLWVGYHEHLPCLIGFGADQHARLSEEIEVERGTARDLKQPFHEDIEYKKRFSWIEPYSLDGSGRFIPNLVHRRRVGTEGAVVFVGAGKRFEIWSVAFLVDCAEAEPMLREIATEMLDAPNGVHGVHGASKGGRK